MKINEISSNPSCFISIKSAVKSKRLAQAKEGNSGIKFLHAAKRDHFLVVSDDILKIQLLLKSVYQVVL